MTTQLLSRKTLVSLWLPIAVLLMGLLFFIFMVIEYQRNVALVEQNRTLIARAVNANLISSSLSYGSSNNWARTQGNYEWIRNAPHTYWFNNQTQEFPWRRSISYKEQNTNPESWTTYWSEINQASTPLNKTSLNKQRLGLLNAVQQALESADEVEIQTAFEALLEHKNAYQLSPQEEIAFSLKLIQIGAKEHWSPELIHTILITGGNPNAPLFRPVVDSLFRHIELFSPNEFNTIITLVKQQLELFHLPTYFLDDYIAHLDKPLFDLPTNIQPLDDETVLVTNDDWLVQQETNTLISAIPFVIEDELQFIQDEFIALGVLDHGDTLMLNRFESSTAIENLNIHVNKAQLNADKRNQATYLILKSLMLIAFMALILITLRLVEKNQQRRLEYLALKEDFVKLVSHELKTPLAGIRAMAETLQKRIDRGLGVQAYPERIINEADKLWYMVDNILSFNRVQLSDAILKKQSTKIKPLCNSIVDDVRSFANKPYEVSNTINESIEAIVDIELFSLVVKNIVVNAGLYNTQATVKLEFSFDANEPCLLISDNGIGIASADKHKVFKPFVRLEQDVRQSGTGLGLAMCKRIMQLHEGDLTLANSDTQGSIWKISLTK